MLPSTGSNDRKRLVVLALGIFGLFSLLIVQFYKIQIIEGSKWTRVAENQHFFTVTEPFLRGSFYSNTSIKKGHPEIPQRFVIDILKFHLYVDPVSILPQYREEIADRLLSLVEVTDQEKLHFREEFEHKSRSRKLSMWLGQENRDTIAAWWIPYASKRKIPANAIYFVADYQRSYPFGKLLGQVLHTVRADRDEITKQSVPTGGLELYFNDRLKGKLGRWRLMRSPRHAFETGLLVEAPENGADIYLTINHYLQAIVEEELAKGVKKANAKGGWAAMMDPKTGEVLALAQYPFFYPDRYQEYFNDPEQADSIRVRAVSDANEPGSIMKPITIATVLAANEEIVNKGGKEFFNPNEKVSVSSGKFPGRSKEIKDIHRTNFLNMYMGLQKSSNVYMARMTQRVIETMGANWYRAFLHNTFGFGKRTQLELPAESVGMLPTPGKKYPSGALEWSVPTPFSMAIGHNLQANAIQMLRAYAVIANGGYLVQPILVRKIVKTKKDGTQEVLVDHTDPDRVKSFPRVLSAAVVKEVVTAMKFVTKPGGSGTGAAIGGYTEAGKTGTARKIVNGVYVTDKHVASFMGFTPVADPVFVLLVSLDEPEVAYIPGVGYNQHAGTCAAPIFREISKRALDYLGITPDDPYGYPVGDPRYDKEKADWVAETKKLSELYDLWNRPEKIGKTQ